MAKGGLWVLSVFVFVFVFAAFAQESKVNQPVVVTRKTYTGVVRSIDQDIIVKELLLDDMPLIAVYIRIQDYWLQLPYTGYGGYNEWTGETKMREYLYTFGEGKIRIDMPTKEMPAEYKIVVVK